MIMEEIHPMMKEMEMETAMKKGIVDDNTTEDDLRRVQLPLPDEAGEGVEILLRSLVTMGNQVQDPSRPI